MKTKCFSCCILLAILQLPLFLSAQFFMYNDDYDDHELLLEMGLGAGSMAALTDLGGRPGKGGSFLKDFSAQTLHSCLSLNLKTEYRNWLGLSVSFTAGRVSGADSFQRKFAARTTGRYERNLSFRSAIYEAALQLELHPLLALDRFQTIRLSPYVHAGIGVFHFNPQAELHGNWFDLAPLATEGQGLPAFPQRKPYSLWQKNIPVGMGLRYEAGAKTMIILDCSHRILFTDYLDDVSSSYIDPSYRYGAFSAEQAALAAQLADRRKGQDGARMGAQRGNPANKDSYFSLELRLLYVLNRTRQ